MPTPHINAKKGDFAKVVLMPGDPLRAKLIAEKFLVKAKQVTNVRGILGFTGFSKNGKKISVMASGMGQPSIGIYTNELFDEYGVEVIIRVGTCGSYQEFVKVKDVVIASGSSTDFNFVQDYDLHGGFFSAVADYDLLETAVKNARKLKKKFHVGNILSEGIFYHQDPDVWKRWAELGILACEMESYALYSLASIKRKKALCMMMVSDSFLSPEMLTSEERQTGLNDLIEIAILTAEKFA